MEDVLSSSDVVESGKVDWWAGAGVAMPQGCDGVVTAAAADALVEVGGGF